MLTSGQWNIPSCICPMVLIVFLFLVGLTLLYHSLAADVFVVVLCGLCWGGQLLARAFGRHSAAASVEPPHLAPSIYLWFVFILSQNVKEKKSKCGIQLYTEAIIRQKSLPVNMAAVYFSYTLDLVMCFLHPHTISSAFLVCKATNLNIPLSFFS